MVALWLCTANVCGLKPWIKKAQPFFKQLGVVSFKPAAQSVQLLH
jgi:hypothetical protein